MIKRMGHPARAGGFTLLMMSAAASILLLTVAYAAFSSEDVANATPFGQAGTVAISVGAALVVCATAALAWRGAGTAARAVAVGLSIVAAGLVVTMACFFLFSDSAQVSVGVLLLCAAVLIALGGREVAQVSATGS